jgi:cystathionine gamma-synthase
MADFGGMISFELAGSEDDAREVLRSTHLWRLAESLGGVESLIEHPGLMTHASLADSPYAVPENLIRLSVGIESADDLIADLEQALARVRVSAARG